MLLCASLRILLGQMKKERLSPYRRENRHAGTALSHQPGKREQPASSPDGTSRGGAF